MPKPQSDYETIKVEKGTVRTLRQLSFEMDKPITKLIKIISIEKLKQLGVQPR